MHFNLEIAIWDGKQATVSILTDKLGFEGSARLLGAAQLSMQHQPSVLDPPIPFNLLFADQV